MKHLILIIILAIVLSACPAEDDGAAGAAGMAVVNDPNASFALTVQPLINQACNCHQTEPILMAPFSLKPGEAYQNLVDSPSMQLMTMPRVTPGNLNQSYLWHKVNGTQLEVGGSGLIMPYTIPLNDQELAVFERWIAGGAPE